MKPVGTLLRPSNERPSMLSARTTCWSGSRAKTGAPGVGVKAFFLKKLPDNLHDRDGFAFRLVPRALDEIFGEDGWESYKHETNNTTWVRAVDS